MQSKSRSSILVAFLQHYPVACKPLLKTWPAWVAALTMLPLLGTCSAGAAPHTKHLTKNKASHAQPVAQGTRLFATGAVDPATSSVKAVSADNRFTWVRVQPTTLIVQAGRHMEPGAITEGDKLLCQGAWVDDAWGPIFQAKRVEIIGRISDAGLQEKVAAACRSVAQSGPGGSGGSSFSQADTGGAVDRQGQDLQDYLAALQDRYDALDQAKQVLVDQISQANGSDLFENKADRAFYGDHTDFRKNFEQTRQDYNTALDRLSSISPVPPAMSKADGLVKQSCSTFRVFSSMVHDDYARISVGAENRYYVRDLLKKYAEGTDLFNQATSETKRVVDNFTR